MLRMLAFYIVLVATVLSPTTARSQLGTLEKVYSGHVVSVVNAPQGMVYAVTRDGELLVSPDVGRSWQVAPLNAARAVAACADGLIYAHGITGVVRSRDSGQTWESALSQGVSALVPMTAPNHAYSCLPNNDLLYGAAGGLYALRDAGATFDSVFTPSAGSQHRFTIGHSGNETLLATFVGCQEFSCGGVLRSFDGGTSFQEDPFWSFWNGAAHGIASTASGTIVVGVEGGFLRTMDDSTWISGAYSPRVSDAELVMPLGGDTLLALANNRLAISVDASYSWLVFPSTDTLSILDFTVSDAVLLAASYDGIYRAHIPTITGVQESAGTASAKMEIGIYPNPFGNSLKLLPHAMTCAGTIEIYDELGRQLFRDIKVPLKAGRAVSVPTDDLPTGRYAVRACCRESCVSSIAVKSW